MNIRKLSLGLVMVLALCAGSIRAADYTTRELKRDLALGGSHYVATDKATPIRIKCVNATTHPSATIQVDGSGNLIFTTNGSTADTTVYSTGTILVADAAANTWGKVAAIINASSNWKCILVDVCPSWTSTAMLTTAAKSSAGAAIAADGIAFTATTASLKRACACMGVEWQTVAEHPVTGNILRNQRCHPIESTQPIMQNELDYVRANATFTSGTTTLNVYAVVDDTSGAAEILLWSQVGAASTADSTIDLTGLWDYDTGLPMAIVAPNGYRIVVSYTSSASNATFSAASVQVHGLTWTP